jgi:agmatine deiminase
MFENTKTNTVYLSDLLQTDERFEKTCNRLKQILEKRNIQYKFLKSTKDIWCRDYMPIQTEKEKFVQFRYEPSYLVNDLKHQSDPKIVCTANRIKPEFSKINLDGGNVVNWKNRAIISDRVFDENPEYSDRTKLINELENLLNAEIIIIPQINTDMTGHADGMVRFVDQNTILGNDRNQEYKYWRDGIYKVLKNHNLKYIDIPFFENKEINKKYPDNAIGCYVNYLEVGNLILLPIFEIEGNKDNEVLKLFKSIFPDRIIETINYNEIGFFGGLLNCTTWTINK